MALEAAAVPTTKTGETRERETLLVDVLVCIKRKCASDARQGGGRFVGISSCIWFFLTSHQCGNGMRRRRGSALAQPQRGGERRMRNEAVITCECCRCDIMINQQSMRKYGRSSRRQNRQFFPSTRTPRRDSKACTAIPVRNNSYRCAIGRCFLNDFAFASLFLKISVFLCRCFLCGGIADPSCSSPFRCQREFLKAYQASL